jgi:hypothetical protein
LTETEAREPLRHNDGNAATGGIWRVAGADGRSRILKVARHGEAPAGSAWQTSDEPTHFNYWRREALAYDSGFADAAYRDGAIRAPRLESLVPREDGAVELWLEDVAGPDGFAFSVERLGRFAYELGVGQARWVGRVPSRAEVPWLSRGWLRQYVMAGPGHDVQTSDEEWEHPAGRAWPERVRRTLRGLRENRMSVLARAEELPRTLCHLDCWPANLIEDADGTSVLLDWAFVGEGAIGEDPANLIVDSVTDGLMDAALLPGIVDAVTEGYIKGLADGGALTNAGSGARSHSAAGARTHSAAGARAITAPTAASIPASIATPTVTADDVRRAIATCAVAKYNWLGAAAIAAAVRGRARKASYNQDDSAEETLARISGLTTLLADWADGLD